MMLQEAEELHVWRSNDAAYLINQKYSLTQTQPYADPGTHTGDDCDPPLSATLRPQLCLSAQK